MLLFLQLAGGFFLYLNVYAYFPMTKIEVFPQQAHSTWNVGNTAARTQSHGPEGCSCSAIEVLFRKLPPLSEIRGRGGINKKRNYPNKFHIGTLGPVLCPDTELIGMFFLYVNEVQYYMSLPTQVLCIGSHPSMVPTPLNLKFFFSFLWKIRRFPKKCNPRFW